MCVCIQCIRKLNIRGILYINMSFVYIFISLFYVHLHLFCLVDIYVNRIIFVY